MVQQKPELVNIKVTQDDNQPEILVPPIMELNLGGFVWFSALAWICTRDAVFTRRFHEKLIKDAPYFGLALNVLMTELSLKRRVVASAEEALNELSGAVSHAIFIMGRASGTGKRVKINHADYIPILEDRGQHDTMAVFGGPTVTFSDVRLDERQVLARWPQAREDLVSRCKGPNWTLNQTVYWVRRQNHVGFVPGRLYIFDQALIELRSKLVAGRLSCRVERQTHAKASRSIYQPAIIPSQHWVGHSLQEDSLPYQRRFLIFDSRQVQEVWPHISTAHFGSRSDHVKFLRSCGLTKRKATEIAQSTPPAKRGPKSSFPEDFSDKEK